MKSLKEKKILDELVNLFRQGNNILEFAYLIHRIFTSKDVGIRLTNKQVNTMRNLE